jgi:phosphate transport system permease protein
MRPQTRRLIKPAIEMMAALPTVVLGFLAAQWLAPKLEQHLLGLMLLPLALTGLALLAAWAERRLRPEWRRWLRGRHLPVGIALVLLGAWLAFATGQALLPLLPGGDVRSWLEQNLGIDYSQRNALLVGIAMGLAVIPVIFSLAEDAISGVPPHLSNGALALGATQWQALVRVVLLTASPGIFSALMIGFGRAVGETMIVLMATGNTPIIDWSPLSGMRTLSANIVIELPESEVNSTHYRILILSALLLLALTFALNTIAELVRQRLRVRYGSL